MDKVPPVWRSWRIVQGSTVDHKKSIVHGNGVRVMCNKTAKSSNYCPPQCNWQNLCDLLLTEAF